MKKPERWGCAPAEKMLSPFSDRGGGRVTLRGR